MDSQGDCSVAGASAGPVSTETLKKIGIYSAGLDVKRAAIDKLAHNHLDKQPQAPVFDSSCQREMDELLAKAATSGASLALARRFERLALHAMRSGDASLTVSLLRQAIIHHPDPKA